MLLHLLLALPETQSDPARVHVDVIDWDDSFLGDRLFSDESEGLIRSRVIRNARIFDRHIALEKVPQNGRYPNVAVYVSIDHNCLEELLLLLSVTHLQDHHYVNLFR